MYLTVNEYLDRFGEAETVRLTDEAKTGDVDTAKVESAISDASEEADAYLGKRYAVPLATPPNLVKSIVAALAREDLYRTRAPDAVKADAERARSQLRDLSRGVMVLPTETGPAETIGGRADSASSGDGTDPIFTTETLAGFGVATGYAGARWRQ